MSCPNPLCDGAEAEGGSLEVIGDKAIQEMMCPCGASWEEVYSFSNYARIDLSECTGIKERFDVGIPAILNVIQKADIHFDTALPRYFWSDVTTSIDYEAALKFVWAYPVGHTAGLATPLTYEGYSWCIKGDSPFLCPLTLKVITPS